MSTVSDDVRRGIKQLRLIEDRFLNGTLKPQSCRRELQNILESKQPVYSGSTNAFEVTSPADQLEFVQQLSLDRGWDTPEDEFPKLPYGYIPGSNSEFLLLVVYLPDDDISSGFQATFELFWELLRPECGLQKTMNGHMASRPERYASVRGDAWKPGIRWVAFDPARHIGMSADKVLERPLDDGAKLAHLEVLMAAVLVPDWVASWRDDGAPIPHMSGMRCGTHEQVPFLTSVNEGRGIELSSRSSLKAFGRSSSPTIREV